MFQVIFYETTNGKEVVLDLIRGLPADDKKVVGEDLKTLQLGYPLGLPLCRPMGQSLIELRSSLPSKREMRLLLMFDRAQQSLVVLHAFIKKSAKTPKADLDLARKRMKEFHVEAG